MKCEDADLIHRMTQVSLASRNPQLKAKKCQNLDEKTTKTSKWLRFLLTKGVSSEYPIVFGFLTRSRATGFRFHEPDPLWMSALRNVHMERS